MASASAGRQLLCSEFAGLGRTTSGLQSEGCKVYGVSAFLGLPESLQLKRELGADDGIYSITLA